MTPNRPRPPPTKTTLPNERLVLGVRVPMREPPPVEESQPPRSLSPAGGLRVESPWGKVSLRPDATKRIAAWILPAVLGAGGGAAATVAKPADPIPPGVLECPAQLEEMRTRANRHEARLTRLEADDDERRARLIRFERRVEQLTGELEELRRHVPRIQGAPPKP